MTLNTLGILLAGGASNRFGQPKAFVRWQDKYFYEHVYEALYKVTDDVVIATRSKFQDAFPAHMKTIIDIKAYDGAGPLAAIFSVMTKYPAKNYVILPCDMPFVSASMLQILYKHHIQTNEAITFVKVGDNIQPLMSIWSHLTKDTIQGQLDLKQFAMKKLYPLLPHQIINAEDIIDDIHLFRNINTASQWKETLKWLKS